jgi:hypothetical protein
MKNEQTTQAAINISGMTDAQIRKTVKKAINDWLASKEGLPVWVRVRVTNGNVYHIDNVGNYFMASAAHICKEVTGLNFEHMTSSMCRLKK